MPEDYVGKSCPFCQTPIKPGVAAFECSQCRTPHHAECWNQNHGCTTFGCTGGRPYQGGQAASNTVAPPRTDTVVADRYQSVYDGPTMPCKEADDALLYAILGVLICGIVFIPLALIRANKAQLLIEQNPRLTGLGKANAAKTISIIAIALWLIVVVVQAIATFSAVSGY